MPENPSPSMGIDHFCKFFDCILPPTDEVQRPFDSILFDVQSLFYTDQETPRKWSIPHLCQSVWTQITHILYPLLVSKKLETKHFTLVLAFDGIGVPMKWPTQRERSSHPGHPSLYGIRNISPIVREYVVQQLRRTTPDRIQCLMTIVSGSNVPGEGEHKLFHIAESRCDCDVHYGGDSVRSRRPLIVSIDQDVFVLALMRRHRYDSIQIFRYHKVYHLSKAKKYPWEALVPVSFLFGNDFAPSVVPISETNGPILYDALMKSIRRHPEVPPQRIWAFLDLLPKDLERKPPVDTSLLVQFWTCYLWLSDYYTKTEFPQKYMENRYYDRFDRDSVLAGLCSLETSTKAYEEALVHYAGLETIAGEAGDRSCSIIRRNKMVPSKIHERGWKSFRNRWIPTNLRKKKKRPDRRETSRKARLVQPTSTIQMNVASQSKTRKT